LFWSECIPPAFWCVFDARPKLGQVLPVALHCVGVGCAVATKVYYDFSPEVGHLESMHLIIRSRMWLFPGVFGPHKRVKRSILDARR
jgi:hypothetical protein